MNIFTYSMALVEESLSNDFQYPMFYIDWILLINISVATESFNRFAW